MNRTGGLDKLDSSLGKNFPVRQAPHTVVPKRKTVAFASKNDSESIKYSENVDNYPIPGGIHGEQENNGMADFYNDLVA